MCLRYTARKHHAVLLLLLARVCALSNVCAGRGRGLFTTAAVAAGDVLLTGAPLALLYCEEGATPENEELAAHLAALAAAAVGGSSGGGLAPWQQRALLQLRGPGEQQQQQEQQVPDLQQLLGPPDERVWVDGQLQAQQEEAKQQQQQQQQQLSDAAQLTRLAFANCTGACALGPCGAKAHQQ
jgi:hypothetical protein